MKKARYTQKLTKNNWLLRYAGGDLNNLPGRLEQREKLNNEHSEAGDDFVENPNEEALGLELERMDE